MIAVFARFNHPEGWGFPIYKEGTPPITGKAHGYVVIAVTYEGDEELKALKGKLMEYPNGFQGKPENGNLYNEGYLGEWFGGQFDYLFSVQGLGVQWPFEHVMGDYQCRGDNRFVGMYDAKDILDS